MNDSDTRFLKILAREGFETYGEIAAELDSVSGEEWNELRLAARAVSTRYAHGLRRIVKRPISDPSWSLLPLFSALLASLTLIAQAEGPDDVPVDLLLDVDEARALSNVPELVEFVG